MKYVVIIVTLSIYPPKKAIAAFWKIFMEY